MAASNALRTLRHALLPLFFLLGLFASAQVDNVYVYGTVKDYVTSKKLDGITVTVYKNGGKLAEVVTSASGKYEFNLDYGSEYKLVYGRSGMVSKNIAIDTKNIPEEERVGGHGMNVEMTLFNELPGIDFSVLQQPIGKAKFDPTTKEVTWDLQYTEQVRSEIARLMKEYDDKKKREAGAEEDFLKLMAQGDAAMTGGDYKKAVDSFTAALVMKAGDAKATARLSDAKMKLDEVEASRKLGEQYATLVKDADALFVKKDYENAKAKYAQASDLKELEAYPKARMKECQAFIDELAKKAAEDAKKKELDDKYNAAIAAGDLAMKGEKYTDAKTKYQDASALKPAEKYPKDQLALIDKKLEEQAKKEEADRLKKELDAKYQALIIAGDAAFKAANYDPAKAKYTEALGVKPEEKYPKDQLAAIEKAVAELEKKAEEDRKKKELDDQYKAAIAAADAAFHSEKWDDAKKNYNEALGIKPKEKYPTDQLAAIDKRIADAAKKAAEDAEKKELDDQYNAAIAAADAAFHGEKWDEARTKYNEALKLKAQERYPKDQLAAIDKAIADAKKKADEDERQKQLEAKYALLIGSADGLLAQNKLDLAKAKYQEALGMKPEQKYPKTKIADIDALLADLARKAAEDAKKKELDDKYNALVAKADKSYDVKKYADALNDYKDALLLKSEEKHPKERIADIQGRLDADAQAKAEKDRLDREKAEKDKHYADLIASADASFKAKQYETAKTGYTDALSVKPEEKYPKGRLADIAKLLGDMASKNEADRLKAEQEAAERARLEEERRKKDEATNGVESRYREAVTKGDLAFGKESFDNARERYTEALAIKPGEKYPKERLAAIEKLLADRVRSKADADSAEAERKRLEDERRRKEAADAEASKLASDDERNRMAAERAKGDQYRNVIADADAALGEKRYQDARDLYTQALDIKPDEVYPKSKIEQIDKLLADQERQHQAEMAAQQVQDPEPEHKQVENSTIDIKKEQEAEQFMREARAREEAEKYDRIKKLKADVADSLNAYSNKAIDRREGVERVNKTYEESNATFYSGSDELRHKNEEEIESLRTKLAERHEEVSGKADQSRGSAYTAKETVQSDATERDGAWRDRHEQRVDAAQQGKDAWTQSGADDAAAGKERTAQALSQTQQLEDSNVKLQERGSTIGQGTRDEVAREKEQHADHQQQLVNRSEDARMAAKEQLQGTPLNQQRSFADYNRGKLANEYPQGVTEESYTEGNKVIIRRVVVQGNKADDYSKVIAKWGTFYFKNGQSISEQIWSRDTEE